MYCGPMAFYYGINFCHCHCHCHYFALCTKKNYTKMRASISSSFLNTFSYKGSLLLFLVISLASPCKISILQLCLRLLSIWFRFLNSVRNDTEWFVFVLDDFSLVPRTPNTRLARELQRTPVMTPVSRQRSAPGSGTFPRENFRTPTMHNGKLAI